MYVCIAQKPLQSMQNRINFNSAISHVVDERNTDLFNDCRLNILVPLFCCWKLEQKCGVINVFSVRKCETRAFLNKGTQGHRTDDVNKRIAGNKNLHLVSSNYAFFLPKSGMRYQSQKKKCFFILNKKSFWPLFDPVLRTFQLGSMATLRIFRVDKNILLFLQERTTWYTLLKRIWAKLT